MNMAEPAIEVRDLGKSFALKAGGRAGLREAFDRFVRRVVPGRRVASDTAGASDGDQSHPDGAGTLWALSITT